MIAPAATLSLLLSVFSYASSAAYGGYQSAHASQWNNQGGASQSLLCNQYSQAPSAVYSQGSPAQPVSCQQQIACAQQATSQPGYAPIQQVCAAQQQAYAPAGTGSQYQAQQVVTAQQVVAAPQPVYAEPQSYAQYQPAAAASQPGYAPSENNPQQQGDYVPQQQYTSSQLREAPQVTARASCTIPEGTNSSPLSLRNCQGKQVTVEASVALKPPYNKFISIKPYQKAFFIEC